MHVCQDQADTFPRFYAMRGHYLFALEFCDRASGCKKSIVEKNV